jgi:hypothetical protein
MNPGLSPSSNEKGILNQVAEQLAPRKAVEENAEKFWAPEAELVTLPADLAKP